jgi:hypothetical protein
MIISLGYRSPGISCSLPGDIGRAARSISLFGLAPNGVYRAFRVATKAVSSYLAVSPLPGSSGRFVFCGTFRRSPGVRVTNHPALRSSDFPPRPKKPERSCTRSGFECSSYTKNIKWISIPASAAVSDRGGALAGLRGVDGRSAAGRTDTRAPDLPSAAYCISAAAGS